MDWSVENIDLVMYRPNLLDIPEIPVPDGFALRTYRSGDRDHWAAIEQSAGEFRELDRAKAKFDSEFGIREELLPERMLFLEATGAGPIATTTAWFGEFRGQTIGMIHWVGMMSEFHGRGLSKPLLAAALHSLARFHDSAHLHTQTPSWRAIGLYEQFGFLRVDGSQTTHRGWAIVDDKLAARRSAR